MGSLNAPISDLVRTLQALVDNGVEPSDIVKDAPAEEAAAPAEEAATEAPVEEAAAEAPVEEAPAAEEAPAEEAPAAEEAAE